MRLVQIQNGTERRVAIVDEPNLMVLREVASVLALAAKAMTVGRRLSELARELATTGTLSYNEIYEGRSGWKLLPPIDCPGEPHRVHISGTGLTHLGSARERQAMHVKGASEDDSQMTDSMRMFEWGRQKGRPLDGEIGIAPEWFHKGDGSILQAPFGDLTIPGYGEDGGEEAEVAGIYLIARDGTPWRIGMAVGNEFSDHVFERRNYLNLAGSKLRTCSIGPELVIDAKFDDVPGDVRIFREGDLIWGKKIRTGELNMCHSLANLEHHHFKFAAHRQLGVVHIHFMGADALSFGEGIRLKSGDMTEIQFAGFGRALRNKIAIEEPLTKAQRVQVMQ